MKLRKRVFWTLAGLAMAIAAWAGCVPSPTEIAEPKGGLPGVASPSALPTAAQTLSPTPQPPEKTVVSLPAQAAKAVAQAQADLAARLDVTMDQVAVVSVEAVEWSDASLGCPQPGMTYAQVITPGFRVLLEVGGETYEYHTDTGRLVILCGLRGPAVDPDPVILIAPHGKQPAKP